MTRHIELDRGGEPHANEPAAPATPTRHMNGQEHPNSTSTPPTRRGDNTPVTHPAAAIAQPADDHLTERSGPAPVAAPPDVPAEVLAALTTGAPGELAKGADSATRAAWWDAWVAHDTARADAYERLHQWARDTYQPVAVLLAIDVAERQARAEAHRSRRDAEIARAAT